METKRAGWRAALPTRLLLAVNAVLASYLVAAALTEGAGWQDGWRDVWAGLALLWLLLLAAWVACRLHRGLPV